VGLAFPSEPRIAGEEDVDQFARCAGLGPWSAKDSVAG
jgi:hypothetical protein